MKDYKNKAATPQSNALRCCADWRNAWLRSLDDALVSARQSWQRAEELHVDCHEMELAAARRQHNKGAWEFLHALKLAAGYKAISAHANFVRCANECEAVRRAMSPREAADFVEAAELYRDCAGADANECARFARRMRVRLATTPDAGRRTQDAEGDATGAADAADEMLAAAGEVRA
jgi:hypothetical protein